MYTHWVLAAAFFLTSKDKLILEKLTKEMKNKFLGCVVESPLIELIQSFITQKKSLGTVESCTGGLLAKLMTDQPGVSQNIQRKCDLLQQ